MPSPSEKDTRQWFLKVADNTVFGPVSTQGLVLWAEEGRIAPNNTVSEDREQWRDPSTIPELEIKWYVRDTIGKPSGPFNRKAIERLIVDGKIPPDTEIFEAGKHSRADAPTTKPPSIREPHKQPKIPDRKTEPRDGNALRERNTEMEKELRKISAERDRLQDKFVEAETKFTSRIESLEAENQRLRRRLEAMSTTRTAHGERIAELETQANKTFSALEKARQKENEFRRALEAERSAHAETLRYANERDAEFTGKIAKLSAPPLSLAAPDVKKAPSIHEGSVLKKENQTSQTAAQVVEVLAGHLKEWVEDEQKRLRSLNALTQNRHETLLHFLRLLREPFANGAGDESKGFHAGTVRPPPSDPQPPEKWKIREEQLFSRIRRLEKEKTNSENDNTRFARLHKELTDRLKLREKELDDEKRRGKAETERAEKIEQSLSRRIEELELAAGSLLEPASAPLSSSMESSRDPREKKQHATPMLNHKKKPGKGFRPTPWMRLK